MAAAHLLHVIWGRTRTGGAAEDEAMCTFHFYSAASTWPDAAPANYETAETILDAYWNTLRTDYTTFIKLLQYRWYREDDLTPPWGEPARVTARAIAGTSVAPQLPPQVALAVTEWTGYQERQAGRDVRHWGRFYLPAPSSDVSASDGRVDGGFTDKVADATDTMYAGLTATGLVPSVRITGWGGTPPDTAFVPVKEIRVNNLWDTIRRRKYETITWQADRDTFGSPTDPES